jgi:hypothetical protein
LQSFKFNNITCNRRDKLARIQAAIMIEKNLLFSEEAGEAASEETIPIEDHPEEVMISKALVVVNNNETSLTK